MERDRQDDEDPQEDEPMEGSLSSDDRLVDPERRIGSAEDYKPGLHSDDKDVDYETRTHGNNRRI
jgi:hypothetical protein